MGIVIDHEARKRDIIAKSIQLFAEQGYDGVTYQKIADECGIARTTLYKYFRNKQQIFSTAIWEVSYLLVGTFEEACRPQGSPVARLDRLMRVVLQRLFEHRTILTVILDFVLAAQRAGRNMEKSIMRHTIGLRQVIHRLIVEAQRKGELCEIKASLATNLVYAQLEAAILRLTVSQNADQRELEAMLHQTITSLKKPALPARQEGRRA